MNVILQENLFASKQLVDLLKMNPVSMPDCQNRTLALHTLDRNEISNKIKFERRDPRYCEIYWISYEVVIKIGINKILEL